MRNPMNTVKLITEASDFNDSNYLIEEDEKGKKSYRREGGSRGAGDGGGDGRHGCTRENLQKERAPVSARA